MGIIYLRMCYKMPRFAKKFAKKVAKAMVKRRAKMRRMRRASVKEFASA